MEHLTLDPSKYFFSWKKSLYHIKLRYISEKNPIFVEIKIIKKYGIFTAIKQPQQQ